MCFAKNEWGTATSNSVFVRAAILNNFKEQPPITKTVEEGKPFKLPCEAPDGWPKPNIYWMIQVSPHLKALVGVAREMNREVSQFDDHLKMLIKKYFRQLDLIYGCFDATELHF